VARLTLILIFQAHSPLTLDSLGYFFEHKDGYSFWQGSVTLVSFCLWWAVVELFERVLHALISLPFSQASHLRSQFRSLPSYSIRCTSRFISDQRQCTVSAHQMLGTWTSWHAILVKYSRYLQSWSYHREPQPATTHSSSDSGDFRWVCARTAPELLMRVWSRL